MLEEILRCRRPETHLAGTVAVLVLAAWFFRPGVTRARDYVEDPLEPEVVSVEARYGAQLLRTLSKIPAGTVTPDDRAHVLDWGVLEDDEEICRAGLWSKREEPGSPWLSWRTLTRIVRDRDTCYVGALSCTDSLCGPDRVLHDRLCLVYADPGRVKIVLYPKDPPSIGEISNDVIDSVRVLTGGDHILLVARQEQSNQAPCVATIDAFEVVDGFFVTLREEGVTQAFRLRLSSHSTSADVEDGDSGSDLTTTLQVTPNVVEMKYRNEDWQETLKDGDVKRVTTEAGLVRYEYSPEQKRFVRVK